jgi:hypothetical protein
MAEQQRISDFFVERHKKFFNTEMPEADRKFAEALRSAPRGFGPHYRRRVMRFAQEISRRHVPPWLKPEQERGEREYRTVAIHTALSVFNDNRGHFRISKSERHHRPLLHIEHQGRTKAGEADATFLPNARIHDPR